MMIPSEATLFSVLRMESPITYIVLPSLGYVALQFVAHIWIDLLQRDGQRPSFETGQYERHTAVSVLGAPHAGHEVCSGGLPSVVGLNC